MVGQSRQRQSILRAHLVALPISARELQLLHVRIRLFRTHSHELVLNTWFLASVAPLDADTQHIPQAVIAIDLIAQAAESVFFRGQAATKVADVVSQDRLDRVKLLLDDHVHDGRDLLDFDLVHVLFHF